MAVERYILICRPFDAEVALSINNRMLTYKIATSMLLFVLILQNIDAVVSSLLEFGSPVPFQRALSTIRIKINCINTYGETHCVYLKLNCVGKLFTSWIKVFSRTFSISLILCIVKRLPKQNKHNMELFCSQLSKLSFD